MILAGTSHATHFSSMLKALLTGAAIVFTNVTPVAAFCVENGTDTRLLFTARIKGEADKGLIFSQWVNSGMRGCGKPERGPDTLEVFVFADEDSVEGCDDEIAAEGVLYLRNFVEFDNCIWGK